MIYPIHMFPLFFILYLWGKHGVKEYFSNVYNHVFNFLIGSFKKKLFVLLNATNIYH